MSRAFLLGVIVAGFGVAALAQSVPVRTGTALPEGICVAGESCSPSGVISAGTVTSQAASGQYSFQPTVAGSRLAMGPGTNQWWSCPDNTKCTTDALLWLGGSVDMRNGVISDSYGGAVRINTVSGFGIIPMAAASLPTCAAAASGITSPVRSGEGGQFVVVGSGGAQTKTCECRYDGTTRKWFNVDWPLITTGTTTTCPDAPTTPGLLLPTVTSLATCTNALRGLVVNYAADAAVDATCKCARQADGSSYAWVNPAGLTTGCGT